MDIVEFTEIGDYIVLRSIKEVKLFYKDWCMTDNGCVNADKDFYSKAMLDAMESSNKYRVVDINKDTDTIWIDIDGKMWDFDGVCIKEVYRLTKVASAVNVHNLHMIEGWI